MDRIRSDGIELDFEIRGSGEPVLFIHGTSLADSFLPLMEVPELTERYQLIRYHRRGYAASTRTERIITVEDHTADARMILNELYIGNAHIVGHDFGAIIALQLAIDAPAAAHSLALAEPPLLRVPNWTQALGGLSPALDQYLAGNRAGAVRAFLELSAGPGYGEKLEAGLPGAVAAAIRDADSFFENDMLALGSWEFLPGAQITQPSLSILSEHPAPFFADGRGLLHEWLPQTEDLDVFNAGHLLQIENPAAMGAGLAWFFARHPMAAFPDGA